MDLFQWSYSSFAATEKLVQKDLSIEAPCSFIFVAELMNKKPEGEILTLLKSGGVLPWSSMGPAFPPPHFYLACHPDNLVTRLVSVIHSQPTQSATCPRTPGVDSVIALKSNLARNPSPSDY